MSKVKLIFVFIVFMMLVSCKPVSQTGANVSNSAAAQKDAPNVPSNMRNAYVDPDIDKEVSVIVSLPNNNEIFLGKRPFEKAALAENLKQRAETFPPNRRYAYIKASPEVEYKVLREILDILRRSEFDNLRLIVNRSDKPEANAVFDIRLPRVFNLDEMGEKPNPYYLGVSIGSDGSLTLNREPHDLNDLKSRLREVFKERVERSVMREGTNETEQTVFVDPAPDVKYGEIVKIISALNESGASPIAFKLDTTDKIVQMY